MALIVAPAADPPRSILRTRALLLLKAAVDQACEARPADPTAVLLTDGLAAALHATTAEGLALGVGDDLADEALAATFGWLIGQAHPHPTGGDAARRIERFIKRTLHAAECTRDAQAAEARPRDAA